jgi:hypothetical protein
LNDFQFYWSNDDFNVQIDKLTLRGKPESLFHLESLDTNSKTSNSLEALLFQNKGAGFLQNWQQKLFRSSIKKIRKHKFTSQWITGSHILGNSSQVLACSSCS